MRYLTLFRNYLRGTRDCPDWPYIFDLLMQIDSWNDCIEELKFRVKVLKETNATLPVLYWFCPSYPWSLHYGSIGWYESRVRELKGELKEVYGIRVDAFIENSGEPEEIIDGQISIDEYILFLNPVFRMNCPDLIEVHP